MTQPYKTIAYKGHTINFIHDENADSPNDCGNTDLFLAAFDSRNFTVERDGFSEQTVQSIFNGGKYMDGSTNEDAKVIAKSYHVFGLEAYIHSGITLALSREGNFPDRQWDVSQLGVVFAEKASWRTKAAARKAAFSLIAEWNQYLSGDVYGYQIDEDGDSCWGFYGLESAEAEGKEMVDYVVENERKAKQAKTRAYITNHVPLMKRTA